MAGVEQDVRRWLKETRLEVATAEVPGTAFALTFKFPSGLQLTASQPEGRGDMVVVSSGLTLDAATKKGISRNSVDFMWNIRRDLLLQRMAYQMAPPEADVPDTIGVSVELYKDGLNKTVFMRAAQDVHSSMVLIILTTRKYVELPD
jgi:hypothetical protein